MVAPSSSRFRNRRHRCRLWLLSSAASALVAIPAPAIPPEDPNAAEQVLPARGARPMRAEAFALRTESARTTTALTLELAPAPHEQPSAPFLGSLELELPNSALSLYAESSSEGPSLDASVRRKLGGKLRLATARRVTLATSLTYQTEGFNLRPAVVPALLLDAALGPATLLVNVSYGHGTSDDERYGAVAFSALAPLGEPFSGGLESSLGIDLERDADEPQAEPELELDAGPSLIAHAGGVALSAHAALSMVKPRFAETQVGAAAVLRIAAPF